MDVLGAPSNAQCQGVKESFQFAFASNGRLSFDNNQIRQAVGERCVHGRLAGLVVEREIVVQGYSQLSVEGREMFTPILDDCNRFTGSKHLADMLPRKSLNQGVHDLSVRHLRERLCGLQLQPMLAGDTVVSPLDLEKEMPAGFQRIVPTEAKLLPPAHSCQIGLAGREPNVVEVNAPNRRDRVVVNEAATVDVQDISQFAEIGTGQCELHLPTRCKVTARGLRAEYLECTLAGIALGIAIHGSSSEDGVHVDVGELAVG